MKLTVVHYWITIFSYRWLLIFQLISVGLWEPPSRPRFSSRKALLIPLFIHFASVAINSRSCCCMNCWLILGMFDNNWAYFWVLAIHFDWWYSMNMVWLVEYEWFDYWPQDLLVMIARDGMSTNDLFRRPGNPQDMKKILRRLSTGRPVHWKDYNFYTLANVVKVSRLAPRHLLQRMYSNHGIFVATCLSLKLLHTCK